MGANQGSKKGVGSLLRVICSLPNASAVINGIAFATVTLEEKKGAIHISEQIEIERAERLCAVDPLGYTIWKGDEEAHARAIEDALDAARRGAPAADGGPSVSQAEGDLRRQLSEQQRANVAQSAELRTAKQRISELEAANSKLTEENNALKATGVRAAA